MRQATITLPADLYGYETSSLTLRREHKVRIFNYAFGGDCSGSLKF
jgi:hypothetical protein